ncbi:unnamed protein product [Blepharisma stoltei]|uniref:Uncharacterized protein n=1 Tax=Blepharisma stoltei TaxID=1481888 RepID=A0AAU9IWD6_9CILI|nr:unnamed protein product [Blepharisma stoltei]
MDMIEDRADPALTYVLASQKSSPEQVLLLTNDISRLLYSQLHYQWIWNYLRSQALTLSPSILIPQSFPQEMKILNRVRLHFINELKDFPHPCEAVLHLKVLVALITRNAIRLTNDDFKELYSILETLSQDSHLRLIELIFYCLMILVTLFDDYSSMLSVHAILSNISFKIEGKRLLYALKFREGKWAEILQEMNDCFGFDVKMPEEIVEKSGRMLIGCIGGGNLDVSEMDDKCLAVYLGLGGKDVGYRALIDSIVNSTNLHFQNLIEKATEKLQIMIPEPNLLELLSKYPNLHYRVLFYSLLYNGTVKSPQYHFTFFFKINVRASLNQASGVISERLVQLITDLMPWFFIPSLSEFTDTSEVSDNFIYKFANSLHKISSESLIQWKSLLNFHPLKVCLETLDVLQQLRSNVPHEILNPLRVFNCIKIENEKTVEVLTSILEVLLSAWQHYVLKYESPFNLDGRQSFILTMQSACVQDLINYLGKTEEIDQVICEFLHSYWIENSLLIKLVHYQGYPDHLLPITVNKIGSLICTWDFITDLVRSGTTKQKRFALQLAGHLSYKYPTQKLLDIIRECIQFIEDNLQYFSEDPELDSILELFLKAFPQLNGRIRKLKRKYPKQFFNYELAPVQLIR